MLLIFGFLFFFSIKTFQLLIAVVDFFMGKETALLRFFKRIKYRRSEKALNNAIIALVEGENQKVLAETSKALLNPCLLYTSPSPRDRQKSRMPSSA